MKKFRATFWICLAACIIQTAAEILLLINIWNLQMIPDRYVVLLASGLVVLLLLTVMLAFAGRVHSAGMLRRWIAAVLALVFSVACIIGCILISDLNDTMDNVINEEPSGVPMSVFVREDDPAQVLSDTKAYTFAIVEGYETERTEYTVASIEEQLQCKINTQVFPSVFDMVDALYAADVGALILNPAYEDILAEMEGYTDFSERTRILCDIMTPDTVENNSNDSPEREPTTDHATTDSTAQTTIPAKLGITERTFIVYLSGTDTKAKVYRTCRSDVNIIAVVNPVEHQVLLLNTPRDYYVPNPAGNYKVDKLTHCGMYGIENSVRALSALYGIDIDYYARINFSGFEKLIDAIGGITVYSDKSFTAVYELTVSKGYNTFDGKEALLFARERYHVAGGDNGRGKNQMKVITAVIDKLTSSTALISNYSGIIDSLGDMFTMSIPAEDVSAMVKLQLDDMPKWEILTFAVTGVNTRAETYSMPGRKLSVMLIDEDYVAHGAKLVNRMLAGERIDKDDLKMDK